MALITSEERAKLVEELKIQLRDHMFGDGQEDGYIMDGFPRWVGLDNMSDLELLLEYGHYDPDVHDTPEKKAQAFREELNED